MGHSVSYKPYWVQPNFASRSRRLPMTNRKTDGKWYWGSSTVCGLLAKAALEAIFGSRREWMMGDEAPLSAKVESEMETKSVLAFKRFGSCLLWHKFNKTRFGPTRPAADMEGNGEFHFWVIFEDFWRHCWRLLKNFWGILEKFDHC